MLAGCALGCLLGLFAVSLLHLRYSQYGEDIPTRVGALLIIAGSACAGALCSWRVLQGGMDRYYAVGMMIAALLLATVMCADDLLFGGAHLRKLAEVGTPAWLESVKCEDGTRVDIFSFGTGYRFRKCARGERRWMRFAQLEAAQRRRCLAYVAKRLAQARECGMEETEAEMEALLRWMQGELKAPPG